MFTISTNHVRDKVAFVEGNERLVLSVDVDPLGFMDQMRSVIADLKTLDNNSTDEDFMRIADEMARKMFGDSQTEKLIEFYGGNQKQIFSVVSRYFVERLNGLISNAQKKAGRKRHFGK